MSAKFTRVCPLLFTLFWNFYSACHTQNFYECQILTRVYVLSAGGWNAAVCRSVAADTGYGIPWLNLIKGTSSHSLFSSLRHSLVHTGPFLVTTAFLGNFFLPTAWIEFWSPPQSSFHCPLIALPWLAPHTWADVKRGICQHMAIEEGQGHMAISNMSHVYHVAPVAP